MERPIANWAMEIMNMISMHNPHIPLMLTNTARAEMDKILYLTRSEGVKLGEVVLVTAPKERTGKSMVAIKMVLKRKYWLY